MSEPRTFHVPIGRRRFLKSMAAVSAGFTLPGYLAEALVLTPQQTAGPFYPLADDIPLDKDNDLVQLNDNLTVASGLVTHISGRILDSNGNPIRNALVELWQADVNGTYIHSTGPGRNAAADPNFAGIGQFVTGTSGRYRFRTIKLGLYPGRTRHLHWGVTVPGRSTRFTTQTYWKGEPGNPADGLWSSISDPEQRGSVTLSYTEVPGTTTGEQQAMWDFVSEFTPVEPVYPGGGSLVIAGAPVAGPGGTVRFRLTVPAFPNYTYEVYGNPTLSDTGFGCLPFALTAMGAIDRHKFTATAEGPLDLYVKAEAIKGFYAVTFRPPGANTGTP